LNESVGDVYQVTGDAIAMQRAFEEKVNVPSLDDFFDSYEIAQLDERGKELLVAAANEQNPPEAPKQAQVEENCQGWAVRVVEQLVREGVLEEKWHSSLVNLMEPVDWR
jgi:hypothetical protein